MIHGLSPSGHDRVRTRHVLSASPTDEEAAYVHASLEAYNRQQTGGEIDRPGIEIGLVAKRPDGAIVGGIVASTVLWVMHLEALWVDAGYRDHGLGSRLVLHAEQLGSERGCIAAQTQTFSFQAPAFYAKLGYRLLGLYDGFSNKITEQILMKKLRPGALEWVTPGRALRNEAAALATVVESSDAAELDVVYTGLEDDIDSVVGAERYNPGISVRVVARDGAGAVKGGLLAWTSLRALILEDVWVDEHYRGQGVGTALMAEGERIARAAGCIACQASSFSFQAPGFLERLGYEAYGVSDAYPDPVTETYFIKRY